MWREIAEIQADGDIAVLYADIRRTTGVPFVNLIYRHIATIPAALAWVWPLVRPLYASGAAETLGAAMVSGLPIPDLPPVRAEYFATMGLQRGDIDDITDILEYYIRGNAMNLLVMCAVRRILNEAKRGSTIAPRHLPDSAERTRSHRAVRPLPPLKTLSASTTAIDAIRAAASHFADVTISRMLPISVILRRAVPDPAGPV
jgi:hypothetical protein